MDNKNTSTTKKAEKTATTVKKSGAVALKKSSSATATDESLVTIDEGLARANESLAKRASEGEGLLSAEDNEKGMAVYQGNDANGADISRFITLIESVELKKRKVMAEKALQTIDNEIDFKNRQMLLIQAGLTEQEAIKTLDIYYNKKQK